MAKRQNDDLRRWAVMGAEARLVELAEEITRIHQQFPELRKKARILEAALRRRQRGKNKAKLGKHDDPGLGSDSRWSVARAHDLQGRRMLEQKTEKKRKRRLSAAGRKAISDAAKARWAREQAAKGSQGQPAGAAKDRKKR